MADKEWTQKRRDLIDLLDDLTGRIRRGCSKGEASTMLETAMQEIEEMTNEDLE